MSVQQARPIHKIHNGLQLDGIKSGTDTIYLQDDAGNVVVGKDANGAWYGKAFSPRLQTATATADGLTTGVIEANVDFVTITSAGATNAVTLPAISASTIGQRITLYVGSNGCEVLTPATSGNTINGGDADGTNQLDMAADSIVELVQITATGWYARQQTASAISVVAADND